MTPTTVCGTPPTSILVPMTSGSDVRRARHRSELTTATGYKGADPQMVDYYFGNLDERRVVWSVGRDLTMAPAQEAGPVNALPKMYVEVDGKVYNDWSRKFTYKEVQAN